MLQTGKGKTAIINVREFWNGNSAFIRGRVAPEAAIHTEGWRGYNGLADVGYSKHVRVEDAALL